MTGQSARLLASILLIGTLIPGATVVCFAAAGHIAVESQFALCCAVIPAPPGEKAALRGEMNDDCRGCIDVPLLATKESDVERIPSLSDERVFAPSGLGVFVNPLGKAERSCSTGVFLPPPDLSPLTPLRC